MPLGLPDCGYCGERLTDAGGVQWMSPFLRGKPEPGWHPSDSGGFTDVDSIGDGLPAQDRKALLRQGPTIEVCASGRLVPDTGWL